MHHCHSQTLVRKIQSMLIEKGGEGGRSLGVPGAACDKVSHPGELSTGYPQAKPLHLVYQA